MRCAKPLIVAGTALLTTCMVMSAATFLARASTEHSLGSWTEPLNVSNSENAVSTGPGLAIDGEDHLHLVWMEDGDTLTCIRSYDRGSSWPESDSLSIGSGNKGADVAVEVSGTVHVVWAQMITNKQLWHVQLVGDSWSPKQLITEAEIAKGLEEPTLAVSQTRVHVVWSQKPDVLERDLHYSRWDGSGWSDPALAADTGETSSAPSICTDQHGNLHVVWQENTSPNQVMYISGTVGTSETSWSTTPITVSQGLPAHATTPDIIVGSDDTVHIVFGGDVPDQARHQDVYYVEFPMTNTGQISPTLIPDSRVYVSSNLPKWSFPSVALNGDDEVHVVWNGEQEGDASDRIYYSMRAGKGAPWSHPVAVSRDESSPDGFPDIAADGTFIHVTWQTQVPVKDPDIYYTRRLPAVGHFPLVFKSYP